MSRSNIQLTFQNSSGERRCVGFSHAGGLSGGETADTTEGDLASIFETAKSNGETLDGPEETIDAAIDDPLAFLDYLILDSDGAITFDSDYARPKPDETQA